MLSSLRGRQNLVVADFPLLLFHKHPDSRGSLGMNLLNAICYEGVKALSLSSRCVIEELLFLEIFYHQLTGLAYVNS